MCHRDIHIHSVQDVHHVRASEEEPPQPWRDHFYLRCLLTVRNPSFSPCTYIKCPSAKDEKEAGEFEEAYKKHVEEEWMGKRHEEH